MFAMENSKVVERVFGRIQAVVLAAMCAVLASTGSMASGQVADQVAAHLAVGEFGPAKQLANGVADPALRDRLLGDVARAQIGGGARNAALQTVGSMADDRYRSQVAEQLNAAPIGGWANRGGGTVADFDTLIDLITSTIAPQSWDLVGGPGAIDSFPGGVYVDAAGLMKKVSLRTGGENLANLRNASHWSAGNVDVQKASTLRKVSLTRLEKQIQLLWAVGKHPDAAMRHLAGLQKIKYVFVYPDSGDIVIAGPAEGWEFDDEGRKVGVKSGAPVLHLDDLIVALRNAYEEGGAFTCSITPRRENLAAAQAYLNESAQRALKPGETNRWLRTLRDHMGKQEIEVKGIDPRSHAARVIVEADYRMKLVGMGLEDGVFGVTSYLDSVTVPPGGSPPPMSVLRWWFTMNYEALRATPQRNAFELRGQGVKVLSENEMLTERGERIHTGKSDELNREFARSFTKKFPELAVKYPIYAELRNVFDLALVAALIRAEDLPGQTDWHMTHFANPQRYRISQAVAPGEVDTVVNHRVIGRKHIVAGVSGGVSVQSQPLVRKTAIEVDDYGALKAEHVGAVPKNLDANAWWWD